jgi:predicted 2-oxoglutarate/Fe(II)-dependent dioxygenase YbiX
MFPRLGKAMPAAQRWAVHLKQVVPIELCRELIRETEAIGYRTALVNQRDGSQKLDTRVRHNLRVALVRPALAQRLLELCRPCLPRIVLAPTSKDASAQQPHTLVDLNSHLRFSKYVDVDEHQFAPHADMSVKRCEDERSLLNLQVYLNDDYSGGETSLRRGDASWQDVRPIHTGDVLVFDHMFVHRTNPVALGIKHTLRTDVFYRPLS